ncbi:MAG: hypothetical protein JXA61_05035 [Bacteroidales bacterium]|nr:hypothetical protein [Bacteroidales bacterium]
MIHLLAVAVVLVTLTFLMLGINIFFFRRAFPETEVGKNRNMNRLGLTCPQCNEKRRCRKKVTSVFLDPEQLIPDLKESRKQI